jgi:hypothetical protein
MLSDEAIVRAQRFQTIQQDGGGEVWFGGLGLVIKHI